MKSFLPAFCLLFFFNFTFAQLGFEQQYVYGEAYYNESLLVADITGNGHMDLIYTTTYAASGDSVKFKNNTDGEGGFSFSQYISSLNNATAMHAADLDGDNDIDIILANFSDDKVTWHRNDYNGFLYFDSDEEEIITTTANAPTSVFAKDLDGDGDNDILVASNYDDTLAWYENTDGNGNFGPEQVISNIADGPRHVESADIDGDGDMDVLLASTNDNSIRWYRNTDGLGTFELAQTITTFVDYIYKASFGDIDGDGDLDVLSASANDSKLAWYENTDGLGTYGAQQVISTSLEFVKEVVTGDLDNDGDQDVIASSGSYGGTFQTREIAWFENIDGQGTFGSKQFVTGPGPGAHSAAVKDIDEDGLLDIVYVSSDNLGWYKNLGVSRNEINGNVRLDSNITGCVNPDVAIPNIFISTTNGTETLTTMSLNSSFYQLFPNEGDYTTTIASQLPSYFTMAPSSHSSSFTGYGATDTANFCLQATGVVNDLSVSLYPLYSEPRPGFSMTYQLIYRNTGNTQQSGTVTLEFDDTKMEYVTANESVILGSNNTLSIDFTDLNPFEVRIVNIAFDVLQIPITNIDDVLSFTAIINSVSEDATVDDNVFTLDNVVIGAYDPNDIKVLEGDEVLFENSDKYLHYIIRFQNTGTAEAINVNVENILDDKLDWTTMQLESLSHDGRVELTNGSQLNFIFDNINLPDSTSDEPNSHGYIIYKIKPLNTVQIGDIVNNTADIYFDFNPAITTNTVSTEFVNPLSIADYDLNHLTIFPNPTSGQLNITSKTVVNAITIIDINGRVLKELQFNRPKLHTEIDLSYLTSGVYFLKIKLNRESYTLKVVVE